MAEKENYVKDTMDINVEIIMRDINGKKYYIDTKWDDIPTLGMYTCIKDFYDCEILMVIVAAQVVYCSLGSKPITWDDLRGYFA